MSRPYASPAVAAAFEEFTSDARPTLMVLRDLVFETARSDARIGPVEEALRWGQPAYLTPVSRSGTTLRLAQSGTGRPALFVHCRTTLISDFRAAFPGREETEGARAVLFDRPDDIDPMRHGWLIHRALTYHL